MRVFYSLIVFFAGVLVGGFLLSRSQPRSIFALTNCSNCLHPNEITGLLVSAAIAHAPSYMPSVILETERSVVVEHPAPQAKKHFVIFPKKDIKNLGELGEIDREYIYDIVAVATELIKKKNMSTYRIWSNGPKTQLVGYLHFHLAGE